MSGTSHRVAEDCYLLELWMPHDRGQHGATGRRKSVVDGGQRNSSLRPTSLHCLEVTLHFHGSLDSTCSVIRIACRTPGVENKHSSVSKVLVNCASISQDHV